jgi:hypothetical protein
MSHPFGINIKLVTAMQAEVAAVGEDEAILEVAEVATATMNPRSNLDSN